MYKINYIYAYVQCWWGYLESLAGCVIKFHGQDGRAFHAEVALKAWPWLCHLFYDQEGRAFRAEMALKAWPWPGLPSFPGPHFPGKPGKKAGKPGQARLFQGYRAFDRAPDARVVLDIFLQIDMRLTAWLHALCYLFYLPLCQVSADKNRSWFFAQRYQLLITTTTITRDTLFYGGNLFNITKMFSHYFQDTRESVTGSRVNIQYAN